MKLLFLTLCCLVVFEFSAAEWNGDCNDPPEEINNGNCCEQEAIFNFDYNYFGSSKCLEAFNYKKDYTTTAESAELAVCFHDCLFQANDWIVNGTINVDKVTYGLGNFTNYPGLGVLFRHFVQKCSDDMDDILKRIENNPIHKRYMSQYCSPKAFVLNDCAVLQFFKGCPPRYSLEKNSTCKTVQPYINKCQF